MTTDETGAPSGRLRQALTAHLGLKAVALLLSAVLWLVVGAVTPTEAWITVRVEPEMDSALALLGEPVNVRALVGGRTADLMKLYATPPVVRRPIAGNSPDTLMLDVAPGDIHVPPDLADLVRVIDVKPRRVLLRFAARTPRRLSVANAPRGATESGQ